MSLSAPDAGFCAGIRPGNFWKSLKTEGKKRAVDESTFSYLFNAF